MPSRKSIPTETLLRFAINAVRRVQRSILTQLRSRPRTMLKRREDPRKDINNQPLQIDLFAEDTFANAINTRFGPNMILPIGEESMEDYPDLGNISGRNEIFAIMDIIDGTDLLVRQFGNWCSAVAFIRPTDDDIMFSMVADHEGNVYYATNNHEHAFFYPPTCRSLTEAIPLGSENPSTREDACIRFLEKRPSGPLPSKSLSDASICFVGQKPASFLAAVESRGLCGKLREYHKTTDDLTERRRKGEKNTPPAPAFRIYNFGGAPMMPKVANGILDAVVGLRGSNPHDVVAGAFIALKAGAFFGDLRGNPLGQAQLAEWLKHPKEKCSPYIIACTEDLYRELLRCLQSDGIV